MEELMRMIISLAKICIKLYVSLILIVPGISVYQEYKIWKEPILPSLSLYAMIKIYIFNCIWMSLTAVASLVLVPKCVVLGRESVEETTNTLIERIIAMTCNILVVGPVEIRNPKHLPPNNSPCVFVANHSSQIDLAVAYFIFRRFKWISKKSVLFLPGVGSLMVMGGHVFIQRKKGRDKSITIRNMYREAARNLVNSIPMFLFPQGTRSLAKRLPFKDGAFNMAVDNKVPIVPISIHIPLTIWNNSYPINVLWGAHVDPVVLTIHPPIACTENTNKDDLKQTCYDLIYSVLPDYRPSTQPHHQHNKSF